MIFEKLKSVTGDINIVFTQVRLQEVKGLWPNPCFNLGNGCVHVVWKKRSLRSVCNKPCHVVVFAKQALIADTASVFLRFAWPAVAFQMILLCCVFTAARAEITGWPERMWTVPRGKTPLSGRLHQLSGIFWGIVYETHHFWNNLKAWNINTNHTTLFCMCWSVIFMISLSHYRLILTSGTAWKQVIKAGHFPQVWWQEPGHGLEELDGALAARARCVCLWTCSGSDGPMWNRVHPHLFIHESAAQWLPHTCCLVQ